MGIILICAPVNENVRGNQKHAPKVGIKNFSVHHSLVACNCQTALSSRILHPIILHSNFCLMLTSVFQHKLSAVHTKWRSRPVSLQFVQKWSVRAWQPGYFSPFPAWVPVWCSPLTLQLDQFQSRAVLSLLAKVPLGISFYVCFFKVCSRSIWNALTSAHVLVSIVMHSDNVFVHMHFVFLSF